MFLRCDHGNIISMKWWFMAVSMHPVKKTKINRRRISKHQGKKSSQSAETKLGHSKLQIPGRNFKSEGAEFQKQISRALLVSLLARDGSFSLVLLPFLEGPY